MGQGTATYTPDRLTRPAPAPDARCDTSCELASMVSHDLKNPLALIKGRVQLLRRDLARHGTLEPGRLESRLAQIEQAVSTMTAMLDELADLSYTGSTSPPAPDRQPTDLVALARWVAAEYQALTERHQIQVRAAASAVVGAWDASRLERVLVNLLSNAIKYSPGGGAITIAIARDERVRPPWAVLRVRDRGIGIPSDDLPRIFDGFHRAHNAVGRASGTGIGLMAVRQIVEQHGGTVTAQSREGRGSKFTVRLPLTSGQASRPAVEAVLGRTSGPS